MGFTVTEELNFPRFGVNAANCYVTIKATYSHYKAGAPYAMPMGMPAPGANVGPYILSARWMVYASNDSSLSPLRDETITLNLEAAPANPIVALYNAIKAQNFAGKTCTDNL